MARKKSKKKLPYGLLEEYLTCQVCGRRLKAINSSHLATHGMSVDAYKRKFGVDCTCSPASRKAMSKGIRAAKSRSGLRPGKDRYRPLDREEILEAIREFFGQSELASYGPVRRKRRSLAAQACKVFGSWPAAVRAAGYQPKQRWSREKILELIRQRSAAGHPLDAKSVKAEDHDLNRAGWYYFGNWGNALKAAGIRCRRSKRDPNRVSRERTIERLRAWVEEHGALRANELRRTCQGLFTLLYKHFGGIAKAGRNLGLPFEMARKARQNHKPRRARAIEKTRQDLVLWVKEHGPLNPRAMNMTDRGLLGRTYRYFGSVSRAAKKLDLPHFYLRTLAIRPSDPGK